MTELNLKNLREDIAEKILEHDLGRHGVLADEILSLEPLATLIKLLDQTRDDCSECRGSGIVAYPDLHYCTTCKGLGKVGEWHPERLVIAKVKELKC